MSRRSTGVSAVIVVAVMVGAVACEDGDDTGDGTVPAIATTISATTVAPAVRSANERFHEVQAGDTLTAIAARYGLSIEAIMQMNAITNPDQLSVGQVLELPLPLPVPPPAPTAAPVPTTAP